MMKKFYPCIANSNGKILKQVSRQAMTRGEAEDYLKTNYTRQWLKCEAIPQSINTPGLHL